MAVIQNRNQDNIDHLKKFVFNVALLKGGARHSSEVERSLMVQWVVGSILHGVDALSYFSFQPVLHNWCNKGCGMYYPVCGMMHIKEPLLLIGKSSLCGSSRFHLSLSEWSFTICLTPYNLLKGRAVPLCYSNTWIIQIHYQTIYWPFETVVFSAVLLTRSVVLSVRYSNRPLDNVDSTFCRCSYRREKEMYQSKRIDK